MHRNQGSFLDGATPLQDGAPALGAGELDSILVRSPAAPVISAVMCALVYLMEHSREVVVSLYYRGSQTKTTDVCRGHSVAGPHR